MTVNNIILEALKKAVTVVEKANSDYCIFGGLAIQAYKRIRSTMDVDLIMSLDEKNLPEFITILEDSGLIYERKKGIIKINNFEILRGLYTDEKSGIEVPIDFVTIRNDFLREILRRKRKMDIFGVKVNVASCEDLILLKVLAARPLDKADAEVLIAENFKSINKPYLKKWSKELGIERRVDYMLRLAS